MLYEQFVASSLYDSRIQINDFYLEVSKHTHFIFLKVRSRFVHSKGRQYLILASEIICEFINFGRTVYLYIGPHTLILMGLSWFLWVTWCLSKLIKLINFRNLWEFFSKRLRRVLKWTTYTESSVICMRGYHKNT